MLISLERLLLAVCMLLFGSRSRKVLLYYIFTDFTVSVYRLNEHEKYYCVLKCGHSILFFLFFHFFGFSPLLLLLLGLILVRRSSQF